VSVSESDDTAGIDARKSVIFQKVGRNVVNLQRLEARFKVLQSMYLDAPLRKAAEAIEKQRGSIGRRTLGPLTHEAVDKLFPEESPQGEFADLTTEVWVTTSLGIEGGQDLKNDMRAQLKKLVDDRNQLVHHMFGGFDPSSVESCSALEARLDEQRVHISEVFRWVDEMVSLIPEHAAEMKKHADEILNPKDS
jgi:hypothetical protein